MAKVFNDTIPDQTSPAGRLAGRCWKGWEVATKCRYEKSIGNAGIFKQAKKKIIHIYESKFDWTFLDP